MATIRVEGLVKRYPRSRSLRALVRRPWQRDEVTALRGIDLELAPGRIYGLVGKNGAGKTTLLKILTGLVLPSDGRALVGELDVAQSGRALRDRVGLVVADERSFYWRLSVKENLRFFATLQHFHGAALEQRVALCLEQVGLESLGNVAFRELSTGLRQRLAIARGLLADPEVLLMDEATRSLDPAAAREVREHVRAISEARAERLVIYSTHTLSEVEELCDEVIVLDRGEVVAREDLRARDQGVRHYRLRTRSPLPATVLEGIDGVVETRRKNDVIEIRLDSDDAIDALVDRVRAEGIGIDELGSVSRRLEDLILRRSGEGEAE